MLASTPSATKIPQELVMLYKWMIGSCDFPTTSAEWPWLFHHGIVIALGSLDMINATKASEEIQMPISSAAILHLLLTSDQRLISFQLGSRIA